MKNWKKYLIWAVVVLVVFFVVIPFGKRVFAVTAPAPKPHIVAPAVTPVELVKTSREVELEKEVAELQKKLAPSQDQANPAQTTIESEPQGFEQELQALERKTFGGAPKKYAHTKEMKFDVGPPVRVMTREGLVEVTPVLAPNGGPLKDTGVEPPLKNGAKAYRLEVASASGRTPGANSEGGFASYWFAK